MEAQERPRPVGNAEIAHIFDDISRLLEVKQDSPFKIRAYHNAARAIAAFPVQLRDMVERGDDLEDIPEIGEAIAKKTTELLATGRLEFFEKLKQSAPAGVLELMRIPGVGPKTAARLAGDFGITSMERLEAALMDGTGLNVGVGEKAARALLIEIAALRCRDVADSSGTL